MKLSTFTLLYLVGTLGSSLHAGTVTSAADSGPGSLRDILANAVPSETIDFAPGLDGSTITLTSGPLTIAGLEVSIDASALATGIRLDGNQSSRIFSISASADVTPTPADVTLTNLHLINGRETANGGGILAFGGHLVLVDCSIRDCFSTRDGGGLWANGVTGSISRSTFAGNEAGNFGGGVYLIAVASLPITSSVFSGNKAAAGGGLSNVASLPVIINCSFQGNSGSGIRNDSGSDPTLRNTILWGNNAASGSTASRQLTNSADSNPDVDYSLIQGASGSASFSGGTVTWGSGNLDGALASNNPLFVAEPAAANAPTSGANLRLMAGSPAFDAGLNSANPESLDLDGNPRIQGTTIDLGAFEGTSVTFSGLYPGLSPDGDENGNGLTNFVEYGMGFDSTAAGPHPPFPSILSDGESTVLTFSERENASDLRVVWQTSTDLAIWVSMVEGTHYNAQSTTSMGSGRLELELELEKTAPRRFYRQSFSQR